MPKTHRRNKHFESVRTQYAYNQNAMDVMRSIVSKNLYKLEVLGGDVPMVGWLLFIKGRIAVTPAHFVNLFEKWCHDDGRDLKVVCTKFGSPGNSFVVDYKEIKFVSTGDDQEDSCFWNFPAVVYHHTDITRFLPDEEDKLLNDKFHGALVKPD